MIQSRRKFIMGTSAAFAASALNRVVADGTPTPKNILAQLLAAGFDPSLPGASLMAVIGDVHINLNPSDSKFTDKLDDRLVDELNTLIPSITDLTIAGDLIVHHSVSIGGNRYPNDYAMSRLEFRNIKNQIQRFRDDMTVRAVPGNHDTDRYEADAELWREELQLPPYQYAVLGGVPVFFMNSGHAGMPDSVQSSWFNELAASIPPNQEVLIIAHHPSFYYVYEEIGLKRLVAGAFAKHRAPVWLVGGHGHAFGEKMYVAGSARFIQMEVTNGNPKQNGDGRSPGYVLLALQGGKIVQRIFRATSESIFETKASLNQLKDYPITWMFDSVEWPAAIYEEGVYSRQGRLVDFAGVDLVSHLAACRIYTVRANLSQSEGKVTQFLLAANIWNGYAPPSCEFSTTGLSGSWTSVGFPEETGQKIYRITIPEAFRYAPNLLIRTKTQLQGPYDGLTIYGWALGADSSSLTGYEKWLAIHYRRILPEAMLEPSTKPAGSNFTNIEHFAFNLPLPEGVSQASQQAVTPGNAIPVTGVPVYQRSFRTFTRYRFARRSADSSPAVTYVVEHSSDMIHWSSVPEEQLAISSLESGWEEVQFNRAAPPGVPVFCRVRITASIQGNAPGGSLSSGDLDGNGIDDLIQYAFDLNQGKTIGTVYDPLRTGSQAGIPIHTTQSGLCSILRFPRVRTSSNPGVSYRIEETGNLQEWQATPRSAIAERVIRSSGDIDEVEAVIMDSSHSFRYYRICLETE